MDGDIATMWKWRLAEYVLVIVIQQHSTVNRKVNGWNTPTINNTIVKCQTSKKGWALAWLLIKRFVPNWMEADWQTK